MAFDTDEQRLETAFAQGRATARSARDFAGLCPHGPGDADLRGAWLNGFSMGRGEPPIGNPRR